MKNQTKNDGKVQGAEAIAAPANNITYAVTLKVYHIDENQQATTVVDKETIFEKPLAIEARQAAFSYARKLYNDAEKDGALFEGHIDSPSEAFQKLWRNFNKLFINIDCINQITGERLTLNDCYINDPPEDDSLENCVKELDWYYEYGLEIDGWNRNIFVEDWGEIEEYEILDYCMG